jgi:gluconolactonase
MNTMYAAPPEIATEIFTRLPENLHHRGEPAEWSRVARPGKHVHSFLEGPAFDRAGNLYCVDIPHGRVFRISPDGAWTVAAEYRGEPNGLKIHRDGRIFIADHLNGVMVMDPASGAVSPFLPRTGMERFRGPNDLFFAANGDLYLTDPGRSSLADPTGRVFRISEGSGAVELLLDNVPYPNGIALTLEETHVLVAATRANAVWRFLADRDPKRQLLGNFIQLSGGLAGPDGIAVDAEGSVAVAHAQHGSVWIFDSFGEPLFRIRSCAGRSLTNIAYGGPDMRTLFILEADSGSVLRARVPTPGKRMFSHT